MQGRSTHPRTAAAPQNATVTELKLDLNSLLPEDLSYVT